MQFNRAARARLFVLGMGLAASGIGLTGCGTVDDALFGDRPASTPPATAQSEPPAVAPEASAPASDFGTTAEAPAAATPVTTGEPAIAVVAIEPGSDTGTSVGQTVQKLRGDLSGLRDKIVADIRTFATLKSTSAQNVTAYEEAKSRIVIRLQVGTTKGNPELVHTWNTAQSALDTLTGNINAFAALGTDLATDAGRAHGEGKAIADAFNMTGGVDEDHRQLTVLQQEASALSGTIDELQTDTTRNVQRQTAFVAGERSVLVSLESGIKNGELYQTSDATFDAGSPRPVARSADSGKAVITIKFDRRKVEFEQDLYTALNKSLQANPGASFQVVAVSPTGGSAAAVLKAQHDVQHHAQDVLKSMTDMGVPASRVGISSSTDPAVTAAEVRVLEK